MLINNYLLALYGGTGVKLSMDDTMTLVTIGLDQTVAYTVGALTCTNSTYFWRPDRVKRSYHLWRPDRRHWGLVYSKRRRQH